MKNYKNNDYIKNLNKIPKKFIQKFNKNYDNLNKKYNIKRIYF